MREVYSSLRAAWALVKLWLYSMASFLHQQSTNIHLYWHFIHAYINSSEQQSYSELGGSIYGQGNHGSLGQFDSSIKRVATFFMTSNSILQASNYYLRDLIHPWEEFIVIKRLDLIEEAMNQFTWALFSVQDCMLTSWMFFFLQHTLITLYTKILLQIATTTTFNSPLSSRFTVGNTTSIFGYH